MNIWIKTQAPQMDRGRPLIYENHSLALCFILSFILNIFRLVLLRSLHIRLGCWLWPSTSSKLVVLGLFNQSTPPLIRLGLFSVVLPLTIGVVYGNSHHPSSIMVLWNQEMANSRGATFSQSEGQEFIGSRQRDEFINQE